MDANQMLENLHDALNQITSAIADLTGDESLVDSERWRANLDQTGYQIATLLSTEND